MRGSRIVPVTVAALALVLAGLVAVPPSAQAATPSYLFTLQASGGSTAPGTPAESEDEHFTLTLRGVTPVTRFADRPFRAASVMSPRALVSHWDAWFASSPPNAVLAFSRADGRAPESIVVSLTRPRYDASGSMLTFTATRIYRASDPSPKGPTWVRPATPRAFSSASLFIDNADANVTDAITQALRQAMDSYVFSPNDANTWGAVQAAMSSVLTQAWQAGTLMGPSPATAYSVNCQDQSAQMILNGYLTCTVTMTLAGGRIFATTLTQQQAVSG